MDKIKFGTDGWRAIIAKDYTVGNVRRVATATALWLKQKAQNTVVIGYDCRFGGEMFTEETARTLASHGIKCIVSDDISSTPMVSLGVVKLKAHAGIVITASHNPASYNGYKLKSIHGGPMIPHQIAEVEALIPSSADEPSESYQSYVEKGLIEQISLEDIYYDHLVASFDIDAIKNSDINMVYDPMYGAGQKLMTRLFPNSKHLHSEMNPSFMGQAPEPIMRNLQELAQTLKNSDDYNFGLANDGDADRIGLFDDQGNFVDSHHILLLLLYYLKEYKKQEGKVVVTFSVTNKMRLLAEHYGLDFQVTKVGFKYIAEIMIDENVLVGGEESGGLAVSGHIPERDGIWIGLMIMEFMAKTQKSLQALISEVYSIVGAFAFDRDDLHIAESKKLKIVDFCKNSPFENIGKYNVVSFEDMDGFKFNLEKDAWLMIRPSGTEPVLRVYAQGVDSDHVRDILKEAHASLNSVAS